MKLKIQKTKIAASGPITSWQIEGEKVEVLTNSISLCFSPQKCLNYHTTAFISRASKVMLKIIQARLQQYMNRELPDVQAGFRKGRGTGDQIANIHWVTEKAREFHKKTYTSASLTILNPLTVETTTNCAKFLERWEYQASLPASCETCTQVSRSKREN